MSNRNPRLGPCLYRARDGKSDLAAIITLVNGWEVSLTVFAPSEPPQFYTRIRFDPNANSETVEPGTCYNQVAS